MYEGGSHVEAIELPVTDVRYAGSETSKDEIDAPCTDEEVTG